jgi:hypothetical protein
MKGGLEHLHERQEARKGEKRDGEERGEREKKKIFLTYGANRFLLKCLTLFRQTIRLFFCITYFRSRPLLGSSAPILRALFTILPYRTSPFRF